MLKVKKYISIFFLTLGVITILAYMRKKLATIKGA